VGAENLIRRPHAASSYSQMNPSSWSDLRKMPGIGTRLRVASSTATTSLTGTPPRRQTLSLEATGWREVMSHAVADIGGRPWR